MHISIKDAQGVKTLSMQFLGNFAWTVWLGIKGQDVMVTRRRAQLRESWRGINIGELDTHMAPGSEARKSAAALQYNQKTLPNMQPSLNLI